MNGSVLKRHLFGLTFGLIVLAYLILFARLPMDSIWISDEGNRILSMQSYALNGDKTLPDPLAGIEDIPSGIRAYPKPYFIKKDGAWRSAYQLLYPWLAAWFYLLLGNFGVQLIAVLGGLLTVLFAGLLTRDLLQDDRRACLVMGLCAFGTPVLFYSGTFLETTCASAAALAELAAPHCGSVAAVELPHDAVKQALREAGEDTAVVICGSLYLASEVRPIFFE